jgi:hypothetical protein
MSFRIVSNELKSMVGVDLNHEQNVVLRPVYTMGYPMVLVRRTL